MDRALHRVIRTASRPASHLPPHRTLAHTQPVPRRPRHIQQSKPNPIPPAHGILPRQNPRRPIIPSNSPPPQQMRSIRQSSEFPIVQPVILLRLLALPNSLFPLRMVSIVMILMHRPHHPRSIHHRHPNRQRIPQQPVVPTRPPHHKLRYLLIVKPARKHKVVDPLRRPLPVRLHRQPVHASLPIPRRKINRLPQIDIPPPPSHQKLFPLRSHPLHRPQKIRLQDNVAIHMTKYVVPRRRLRPLVNIGQIFRPISVPFHRRNMPNPQFRANLRRPRVIPHQNNLHIRMQPPPAGNGIPLNHINMPNKRLRRGKHSDHRSKPRKSNASVSDAKRFLTDPASDALLWWVVAMHQASPAVIPAPGGPSWFDPKMDATLASARRLSRR